MPLPSPLCLVGGSPPPFDAGSGATVTGGLVSGAGALYWSLQCTDTDETNTAAAVNATLVLNQTLKTFSFTAPASLGSAVRLMSTVGIACPGLDANGVSQPSFTSTFKVNVRAANGLAVVTTNEVYDQSTAFGWIAELNAAIRATGGSGVALPTPPGSGTTVLTDTTGVLSWAALGAGAGGQSPIDFVIGTAGTTSSAASIAAASKVWKFYVTVTSVYAGAGAVTLTLGQTGLPNLLTAGPGAIDLTAFGSVFPSTQEFTVRVPWGGSPLPVLATISGSPSTGAGAITVFEGPTQS